MESKTVLEQLSPYKQGKQTDEIKEEFHLDKVIKLASNENPYGYSPILKKQLSNFDFDFNIYPDGYTAELRNAVANKFEIKENRIVFGCGSDELIQMICRAYLYPGKNTVMATPTFPQYRHNALVEGGELREIPTKQGYHDLEKMLEAIDEDTSVVWLCTPDNPTGTLIDEEQFTLFMEACPSHVLVVLDEAYYEFVDSSLQLNTMKHLEKYPNLIVLRTFSKAYGLAGIRIGYGLTNENIASKIEVVRGPFNTTSIAQRSAVIALQDNAFLNDVIVKNKQVKQDFEKFLDELDWSYYDSHTNFLLVNTPISGNDVFQFLIAHGFIIRPGDILGYPNTIRVTIGTEEEMAELQTILKKLDEQTSSK